jgi:hypothetical protein
VGGEERVRHSFLFTLSSGGATYIDLHAPEPREFKALGTMEAGPENWYVPKSEIDYQLWNLLIGVDNPERLGRADEE